VSELRRCSAEGRWAMRPDVVRTAWSWDACRTERGVGHGDAGMARPACSRSGETARAVSCDGAANLELDGSNFLGCFG